MTTLQAESRPDSKDPTGLRIRVLVREGSGAIHLDWPADQIRQAIEDPNAIVWVDLENPGQNSIHESEALLRDLFGFHSLAIEDALEETHVPKVDDWCEYLYIVFHTIDFDIKTERLQLHELDLFLGRNYLVTYHTESLPALEQVRHNIERDPNNRLRHGADHLLYHVLDMSVAEYLPAIEHLDEVIDKAQDEVFQNPTQRTVRTIFRIKRAALRLHRTISPEREVLNRLARDDFEVIKPEHRVYFRDIYDHLVRIHDISEGLRDLISGALDTYLSAISNRTNDIMKTLTIVTVMFLPISFVTSFFGMNFFGDNLSFKASLPKMFLFVVSCLLMTLTPPAMYLWARWRGWF